VVVSGRGWKVERDVPATGGRSTISVGSGGTSAAAIRSGYVNDCHPYCAAGHFTRYPAVLIATRSQRCPNGERADL